MDAKEKKEVGETHHIILQVAQQLFSTYGYRSVTTRQIARACGITQPALYRHFTDKQHIYTTLLLTANARVKAALERIAQRNILMDERLQLSALYLLSNTQQDIMMMVHDIQHELTTEARIVLEKAFIEGTIQPLASIFEDGIQQGLLRSSNQDGFTSSAAAFIFLNLVSQFLSLSEHATAFVPQLSKDKQAMLLVQFCLHGMAIPINRKQDT